MKGMLKALTAVALASAFVATSAQAQSKPYFGLAGSGLFSLETGGGSMFGGTALVGVNPASSPVGFRIDGSVFHKSGITPIQGTANIVYTFKTSESSKIHPYLLAGGGVYHQSVGGVSLTKPVAKAGAGFDYPVNKLRIFAEPTFNLLFTGNGGVAGAKSTRKDLQVNVGVKFGG